MRILFFSHYFPPEGNAPASRTHENARRWVREGHEVTVVTCAPNCPDGVVYEGYRNPGVKPVREMVDGIHVVRVWTYIAANKGTLRRILNYLSYMLSAVIHSLFLKRPDIVVSTSPQFFCGWAGILAGWLKRVPCVLEIRDIWPESIVAVGAIGNPTVLRILEWLELRMYRAARHIVTVGEGYRRRLLEKGVPEGKVSIVPNGVDREAFSPRQADPALRRELGLEGRFVCSYVGTIGMACALDVVVRAARLLRDRGRDDIGFVLVGDGAVREELEAEARRQGLDRVVFTGRRPKERVPEFLATSDACLVHLRATPLFETVMPSKIFEAAAMERPIVLGVRGVAADLLRAAEAGICIEPQNEEELVDALVALAADPVRRRAMGQSGRRYVVEHFDRDRLARDYLAILQAHGRREDKRGG